MIAEAEEIITISKKIGVKVELLADGEAKLFIQKALELFSPFKNTGHLGIGHDSFVIPITKWEYSYMDYLCQEKGYIFFPQRNLLSKKTVVRIEDLRMLGKILEESFGMEYFLTNRYMDFLIAVNWYAIEVTGTMEKTEKLRQFIND